MAAVNTPIEIMPAQPRACFKNFPDTTSALHHPFIVLQSIQLNNMDHNIWH
jgi:hypothetical protein